MCSKDRSQLQVMAWYAYNSFSTKQNTKKLRNKNGNTKNSNIIKENCRVSRLMCNKLSVGAKIAYQRVSRFVITCLESDGPQRAPSHTHRKQKCVSSQSWPQNINVGVERLIYKESTTWMSTYYLSLFIYLFSFYYNWWSLTQHLQ